VTRRPERQHASILPPTHAVIMRSGTIMQLGYTSGHRSGPSPDCMIVSDCINAA